MNLITRVVPHLVCSTRRNPNTLSGSQGHRTTIHFHDRRARKNVEELLRVMVEVANLRRARRHALLDHAELRIPDQVPAVTMVAPDVMLGGCFADRADVHTVAEI